VALRRLRRFAREGAASELALDDTIRATAKNAGWLDIKMVAGAPQRREGPALPRYRRLDGRSRSHLRRAFSTAARAEFKHLEYFYFHNCPYEKLWKDAARRHVEKHPDHAGPPHLRFELQSWSSSAMPA